MHFVPKKQSGFVSLSIVAATAIIISAIIIGHQTEVSKNLLPKKLTSQLVSPPPSPLAESSPSPSPSPSPPPSPIASPTPKPSTVPVVSTPRASGFARLSINTERGVFTIAMVSIPKGATMVTDTASDNDCTTDCPTLPLADFVQRNGGFAGIHGSYFCPQDYSDCQGKKNSFDFPVYNSRLSKWINQGNLFWCCRSMIYQDGSGLQYRHDANSFGGGLSAGVVNFPGLLNNGHITVSGDLSQKQSTKGTKGGIGFSASTIYLVVAYNADMTDFAHIFKALGASHALNLDGGGSVAIWYGGGYKVGPGRSLPNAIVFR